MAQQCGAATDGAATNGTATDGAAMRRREKNLCSNATELLGVNSMLLKTRLIHYPPLQMHHHSLI